MPQTPANPEHTVATWGFPHVFTWSDPPHAHYSPHTHAALTTHLVLAGTLTIAYPRRPDTARETHGVGARVDVPAGELHEVWMGDEGCTYVIGE